MSQIDIQVDFILRDESGDKGGDQVVKPLPPKLAMEGTTEIPEASILEPQPSSNAKPSEEPEGKQEASKKSAAQEAIEAEMEENLRAAMSNVDTMAWDEMD